MDIKTYKNWLSQLSMLNRIKYFISIIVDPKNTKLNKFGGFTNEVSDYRLDEMKKHYKQPSKRSSYDIEVKYWGLENCVKSVTSIYSSLTKAQLKKLPQYKLLPKEIKRTRLSRELLIMALVTYHIGIYRVREQYFSKNKEFTTILPKGTQFYHGRFAWNPRMTKRQNFVGETWISRDKHNSLAYASQVNANGTRLYDNKGITLKDDYEWLMYVFKSKRDLKLLNINLQVAQILKHRYPYMNPIIDFIFPIKEGELCRNSIIEYDYVFSMFVCHILKLDGYTAACFKNFQEEEMLCDIQNSLTEPVVYMWKGKTVNNWLNKSFGGKLKPNEKIALVQFYQNFSSFE